MNIADVKLNDRVMVSGSGYIHKGEKGTVVKISTRLVYVELDNVPHTWPYRDKDLNAVDGGKND